MEHHKPLFLMLKMMLVFDSISNIYLYLIAKKSMISIAHYHAHEGAYSWCLRQVRDKKRTRRTEGETAVRTSNKRQT